MISPPVTNSPEFWPCVLTIMTSYFTATTVDIHTQVDIAPIAKASQWAFLLTDQQYLPKRKASVDLLIISENIDDIHVAGTYGKVIAVTQNLNNTLGLWRKKRLADTVVIYTHESSIHAYTWFPYNPKNCWTEIRHEFLATCLNGEWDTQNLYPNKVPENFQGCPVKYLTFPLLPDNRFDWTKRTFFGREVELMRILAESMKLTPEMLPLTWDFFWYPAKESAMYQLENGLTDFAFATLIFSEYYFPYAQPLPCHNDQPVVWMIPRARPKSMATNIYSGFPLDMWATIFIVLIVTGLIVCLMAWTENQRWYWLDLMAAFVASPVSAHRSTTITAFIFLFQVYSLHVAWFYQSFLLGNLFEVPMERQIQSPSEAADRGLVAALFKYLSPYFNHTDHEMWNKIFSPGLINITTEPELFYDAIVLDGTMYTLGKLNEEGYALRKKYGRNLKSMVLTIPFMSNPVTVYSLRGSPLTARYTLQMGYALQSGLYEHFKTEDKFYTDTEEKIDTETVQVITMETLAGAFYILGCFLGLALTVFLTEVLFDFGYRQCIKCYRSCKKIPPDRKPRHVIRSR